MQSIGQIFSTFTNFVNIYNNGVANILERVNKDVDLFRKTIDSLKVSSVLEKFKGKIKIIDDFTKGKFPLVDSLLNIVNKVVQEFSFESIKNHLVDHFNKCKGIFMQKLSELIPPFSYKDGDLREYGHNFDYMIPIGPVPLVMSFGFGYGYDWGYEVGLKGLSIFAGFNAGVNTWVSASLGVGIPMFNVSAYIRGTIASAHTNFGLSLQFLELKVKTDMCFSISIGSCEVGVQLRFHMDCWLFSIDWTVNFYGPRLIWQPFTRQICPFNLALG